MQAACRRAPAGRLEPHCPRRPIHTPRPRPLPAHAAAPEPLRRWLLPHQHLYTGPLLLFAKAQWNLKSLVVALGVRRWAEAAGIVLHYAAFSAAG